MPELKHNITFAQKAAIDEIDSILNKYDFWLGEEAYLLLVLAARKLNKDFYNQKKSVALFKIAREHPLASATIK